MSKNDIQGTSDSVTFRLQQAGFKGIRNNEAYLLLSQGDEFRSWLSSKARTITQFCAMKLCSKEKQDLCTYQLTVM